MTARFPSRRDVGDLLAQGLPIAREQEALQDAPGGQHALAVWGMPDPFLESGEPWYVDGMPVIVPVVLTLCDPDESVRSPYWPQRHKGPIPLGRALNMDVDPFIRPTLVGESSDLDDLQMLATQYSSFSLDDDHLGRDLWDVWPVTPMQASRIEGAANAALDASGYQQLNEWWEWENGYSEPYDIAHEQAVLDRVMDGDMLKGPDEFRFDLKLTPEDKDLWRRLTDISQQSWLAFGMTLPPDQRRTFYHFRGDSPWF